MREIGIFPRFSRDKFVPLQTKQRYSTRDISDEVFLTLFFRGFVPFLSLADFVSRDKNLQVIDLQRLKSCFGELVTATTSNHQKGLLTAIEHLKECFPQAGILLLSVGDRDSKNENGELRTMPGVKNLIRYQQNIAAESGIAFWNMFEAMGGEGSMAKLVHAKPSMANYDYTHINFRGGKHLAGLLYETMIYGKEQYDRRRAYEQE